MRLFLYAFLLVLTCCIWGCASSPNKVRELDTEVKSTHGSVQESTIAVDKQNQAILQKETSPEAALREQIWKNFDLEKQIQTQHESLKRCLTEMSDPRLGGSSQVMEAPELDVVTSVNQQKEELGINKDGDLKIVQKEFYLERLQAERKYGETLTAALKTISKRREQCDRDYGYARVKNGLPAERYRAEGYYDQTGRWVQTRPAEHNLDEAFQIRAKERSKTPDGQ